jgi:rhamnosyl/mannosyltransferase
MATGFVIRIPRFLRAMSAALKVLHSYKVYRPDVDGGIPFAMATLSRPSPAGTQNEILVARLLGMARKFELDGVPVRAVSSFGNLFSTPIAPGYPFTLMDRVKSNDILVHHAPFPIVDVTVPYLPREKPLIVFWHADIVGKALLKKLLTPSIVRTLTRADKIVVADQSTIDGSPFLPAFADKCAIVPYGIDIDYWATCTAAEQAEAERLRQKHPRMIIATGRLVPYKGFDVLLQALRDIDGHVVFIGEGPLREDLKKIANNTGVAERVTFAGRVSAADIKAYLHAAKVFAFPSVTRAEAFGIVQLEAMAAGLPIVNTSLTTAVPHIARHDQEALTVKPHDSRGLAEAISRILDDAALARRLGEAGKDRARSEYSQERYVLRMEEVYEDVLRHKPRNSMQDKTGCP